MLVARSRANTGVQERTDAVRASRNSTEAGRCPAGGCALRRREEHWSHDAPALAQAPSAGSCVERLSGVLETCLFSRRHRSRIRRRASHRRYRCRKAMRVCTKSSSLRSCAGDVQEGWISNAKVARATTKTLTTLTPVSLAQSRLNRELGTSISRAILSMKFRCGYCLRRRRESP
jgi:hypothetical protein